MTNMPSTIGTTEETTISTAIAIGKNRNGIIKHMTAKEPRGQMSCGALLTRSMGLIRDCGRIDTHRHRHTQPCHVALTHMSTDARSHMTPIAFNRQEQNATAHPIGSGKALQADGYRVKTRPSGSSDMTTHRPIFCTQIIRKMPSQDIIIYRPRHHLCVKDSKWIGERKERKATTAYRSATVKMRRCRHSRTIGKCLTVQSVRDSTPMQSSANRFGMRKCSQERTMLGGSNGSLIKATVALSQASRAIRWKS